MAQSLKLIALTVNIYSFLCFIRIIITWLPGAGASKPGQILSAVCDPYLNIFRRFKFLTVGGIDLSATLALCVLFALATIIQSLAGGHALTVGYFLTVIVSLVWSFISAVVKFFTALLIIRLVIFAIMRAAAKNSGYRSYSPLWDQIDRFLTPFIYKVSGLFVKRIISFTTAMIITVITLILGIIIADRLVGLLCYFLSNLPF